MKVTSVSVKLGKTCNMGDYENFRPEVAITADLEDGDTHLDLAIAELHAVARHRLHGMIDQELEDDDRPPKYYDGPRYKVVKSLRERLAVLLPDKADNIIHPSFVGHCQSRRFNVALAKLQELGFQGYEIYDCREGETILVPKLKDYIVCRKTVLPIRYWVIFAKEDHDRIPDHLNTWSEYSGRRLASVVEEINGQPEFDGEDCVIVDCTDGDWSKMPTLPLPLEDSDDGDMDDDFEDDDYEFDVY